MGAVALLVESTQLYRERPELAQIEYSCLKCDCVYAAYIDRLDPEQIFLEGVPLIDLRGAALAHRGAPLDRNLSSLAYRTAPRPLNPDFSSGDICEMAFWGCVSPY